MNERREPDAVDALLRTGDPLPPGETLPTDTVARMRRRVLAALDDAPAAAHRWRLRPALALAAAVILAVAGAWWTVQRAGLTAVDPTADHALDTGGTAAGLDDTGVLARRQVQFVTAGGTRIIWTLDPDLSL